MSCLSVFLYLSTSVHIYNTYRYVVDKSIGNSGGMGGLFGPLYAIGKAFPFPEAQPYKKSWQYTAFGKFGALAQKLASLKK